jgi:hypothetical protein
MTILGGVHPPIVVHCIYCEVEDVEMIASEIAPDDLRYPGIQQMCRDDRGCMRRIHNKFHNDHLVDDCMFCTALR